MELLHQQTHNLQQETNTSLSTLASSNTQAELHDEKSEKEMNEEMNNGAKHSLMVLHEVALVGPLEELCLRCCGAVGDHRGVECIPDLPGREDEAPAHQ